MNLLHSLKNRIQRVALWILTVTLLVLSGVENAMAQANNAAAAAIESGVAGIISDGLLVATAAVGIFIAVMAIRAGKRFFRAGS
jgi:hypothetical protein